MQNNFGIRGRRKNRAFLLQLLSVFAGERQVAVVADGYWPVLSDDGKRLALANRNFSGRRISHVADRVVPPQPIEPLFIKAVAHVAHSTFGNELRAVRRDDAA